MKIFIWIGYKAGGYEQRTLGFAKFLKRRHPDFDITLGFYESRHEQFGEFKQVVLPYIFSWKKIIGFNNLFNAFRPALGTKFLDQFDMVYGKLWHKTKAVKMMRVAGDNDMTILTTWYARLAYFKILLPMDKVFFRRMDAVVSASPDATKFLYRIGCKNVIESLNFVDTTLFFPMKKAKKPFEVLYVGSGDPRKNLVNLQKAVNELGSEYTLTTIGVNNWVSRDQLRRFYNACDVVVVPSYFESFCNVVLEAMACSKPLVVSRGVTASRLVEPFVTLCDTDVASIKKAISDVKRDYDKRVKLASTGCDYVVKNFSEDGILNKECQGVLSFVRSKVD